MNTTEKIVWLLAGGAIVGLAVFALSFTAQTFGLASTNSYVAGVHWQGDGLYVGRDQQLAIDGSGNVTTSGSADVSEFTQGGGIATLTDATGGTYTLTEAELLNNSVLKFAAGGQTQAVIALTLPATSTWTSLIPNAGDMREWIYDASALAAATTTTITAGTGIDLIAVTANDDVIDGAEFARLTCWRQDDTDVSCITSELLHAD